MTHSLARFFAPTLVLASAVACNDPVVTVSRDDNVLRRIDPLTAQTLSTVTMTAPGGRTITGGNGLAVHPTTGQLWGILKIQGSGRVLARIDEFTGAVTTVGVLADSFAGLAFDAGGTLFGVTGDGANLPSTLWTLDQNTAQATRVLALDNSQTSPDGETIAFNPADGKVYRASGLGGPNTDEVLDAIDTAARTFSRVTLSGYDYDAMGAMTHWAGGVFLAVDLDDELVVLSDSGVVTAVATLDHTAKGIAVLPPLIKAPNYVPYGVTCAGPSTREPLLAFRGSPAPGSTTTVGVIGGPASASGAVLFGLGNGTVTIGPCVFQILPLIPGPALPFTLDPAGRASGPLSVPVGTPVLDLYLQAGVIEGSFITLTNGLQMHIE